MPTRFQIVLRCGAIVRLVYSCRIDLRDLPHSPILDDIDKVSTYIGIPLDTFSLRVPVIIMHYASLYHTCIFLVFVYTPR